MTNSKKDEVIQEKIAAYYTPEQMEALRKAAEAKGQDFAEFMLTATREDLILIFNK